MSTAFEPGAPTPPGFIPLCVPEIRGNAWKYVKECLDSTWISSVGLFVDRFEAILNPPQSIIVAVGKIAKRPVVECDLVVARLTMPISLSVDHRVVDGVPAAQFLQTLVAILESPESTYTEWE